MNNANLKKKVVFWILGVVLVAAIAAGMWLTYNALTSKPDDGLKTVTVNVADVDGNTTEYVVKTNAGYLRGVMDEIEGLTYETNDGMVMVVNGQRADYVLDGAYWAFFVNGEYCNYGIADQPVNDGDVFEIRYTKA